MDQHEYHLASTSMSSQTQSKLLQIPSFQLPAKISVDGTESCQNSRRPAFEKILIGPLMCVAEDIAGGNYLEVLRLGKQMYVGWAIAPSYRQLHRNLLLESSTGVWGVAFRGFFPWGMSQGVLKGAPVLFVQNETKFFLNKHKLCQPRTSEQISGCMSGAVQAVIMTPFQKLKVTVVASDTLNRMKAWDACAAVVSRQGILSLFDGLFPTLLRRSMDWGIRFGACGEIKRIMIHQKEEKSRSANTSTAATAAPPSLTTMELMICSMLGGAVSGFTHPIDNIITNAQKPLPEGSRRDILSVMHECLRKVAFVRSRGVGACESSKTAIT
jgi:hypothetical protein